jgi:hypothetical protein
MYQWVWDGMHWRLYPVSMWDVGARRATRRATRRTPRRAMMATPAPGTPGGAPGVMTPGAAPMAPGGLPTRRMASPLPPSMSPISPPAMAPPLVSHHPPGLGLGLGHHGGGWGWGGPGVPGVMMPGGGGGGDGSPGQPQATLWLVDVDGFGTFEGGMQVKNEQVVAQGDPQDLQQQQADKCTSVLPCVPPGGSGQVTVILPDGQKPSDGQGWASSQNPCPSDPNTQNLEPVGVPVPVQSAAAGWMPMYAQYPQYGY